MHGLREGFGGFDFLIGDWTIENGVLAERLKGSTTRDRFSATSTVQKVMDGCGNLDQMFIPERGFTGMTLRLFDPAARLWSICWSDTRSHRLFLPTIGRFDNGVGRLHGDDVEAGIPVKVTFLWTTGLWTTGSTPVWEQSFSSDGGQAWEKNWVMRFTRRVSS